ncbi:MarR family winged helix-turn-helix transcriptional regulator [Saccharomonospora piscinae]|uniref:MarR family winged helix-turn-helix transcriptional regulator n=1 Tax=Saccharomonospora piscinae TaxID=687388 RepID=UPI000467377D|nr:MarR family winged helix-turn-helix transcriptional regulator [Saccharomonospora piscinae]TLW90568.1 winged helix-turn-helix transcriptional regulator [Saccharomonospora piscinae]
MADGELPMLFATAFRAVMDHVHDRLAAEGFDDVRPAHGFVFQYLSFHRSATAVQLGDHLGITKQAAVQLVDELERRGYVARTPHPHDRRSRLVSLTPRGWACVQRVTQVWREVEQRWAELIGSERLEQLRADIATLTHDTAGGAPVPLRPLW